MEQRPHEELLENSARLEGRAFEYHRQQYRRENPPPRRPSRWVGIPWMMIPFAAIVLAGSALSALRTAPVFIQIAGLTVGPEVAIAEGILAMIAIDMAAVLFRFAIILLDRQNRETEAAITRRVKVGFWIAFLTQAIAQIYAVRGIATVFAGIAAGLELAIALAAALSGMVLAFTTGEIMAVLWMRAQAARERADQEYRAAVDEWFRSMRHSWNRKKVSMGIETPLLRQRLSAVVTDNADSREPASPSVTKALTWLQTHPDATGLPVRTIADMAGVNRDAVSRARRMLTASEHPSVTREGNGTH